MNARIRDKVETMYGALRPLERKIVDHIVARGYITARDAMMDYGITSASLTRRICDLEELGFVITRERTAHPVSGQKYTRYSIAA